MANPPIQPPFFKAGPLPQASDAYVAWLDVTGIRATMLRSLPVTANFVFKLRVAVLETPNQNVTLYPVFGVFVHESARDFLSSNERKNSHVWWPWFSPGHNQSAQALRGALPDYFDWCEERAGAIDYDHNRVRAHRHQADQYLVDA